MKLARKNLAARLGYHFVCCVRRTANTTKIALLKHGAGIEKSKMPPCVLPGKPESTAEDLMVIDMGKEECYHPNALLKHKACLEG